MIVEGKLVEGYPHSPFSEFDWNESAVGSKVNVADKQMYALFDQLRDIMDNRSMKMMVRERAEAIAEEAFDDVMRKGTTHWAWFANDPPDLGLEISYQLTSNDDAIAVHRILLSELLAELDGPDEFVKVAIVLESLATRLRAAAKL